MNVPLVDLKTQYAPLKDEILTGIAQVFEGMRLNLGENVQAFEKEFTQFCGTEFGIGVSDGTSALSIILRAMDIGPGDEVITVAHTFIATIEAILMVGARPVFVDIYPDTCLMDVSQVKAKITPHTRAILPVHLYGQMVEMNPLLQLADQYGLAVIEDACQAHGAMYKGLRAGSMGDASAFSFYCSKNLGAYGEGGFITTNDREIARKVRMIRDHGSERRYYHDLVGMNARLDEIQAVILRTKLPHLDEWNQLRRQHAKTYDKLLAPLPVKTPVALPENYHVYHLYVIQTQFRDELQEWLKQQGVGTGIHYPVPSHLQKALHFLDYRPGDLPITEQVVSQILSLPMYAELTEQQIQETVDSISEFVAEREPVL
jgi:dTDP-4-amino-4,6-dideoxygalactose transaminase